MGEESGDQRNDNTKLFKYVLFDLPFVVFVEDGFRDENLERWAEAVRQGEDPPYSRYAPCPNKPGSMIIGGGMPVYLPSGELADHYEVPVADTVCALDFLRRVNPHRPTVLMGEVPGDRTGRASFSTVRVTFDLRGISDEYHEDMVLFVNLSISAINHFLQHYRVVADRPYVTPVTPEIVQEFHLGTKTTDGSVRWQEFGTASGALHGFGGSIDEAVERDLRKAVSEPEPPEILQTLEVEIRNYLDLREWRLAVIEAAILFEAYVEQFIRRKFQKKSLSDSQIDDKFTHSSGHPKSITSLAKGTVEEASGFDFKTTTEYDDWESHVRDLRNELVHAERFDVSEKEARRAYHSSLNAIQLLNTK